MFVSCVFFLNAEEEGTLPDFYDTHPNEWNGIKTRHLADLLPKLLDLLYFSLDKKDSSQSSQSQADTTGIALERLL